MPKLFDKGHKPWNKGLKTGLVPRSAFKKGYQPSQETLAKRRTTRAGYRHTEETKRKIGEAHLGKKYPYKKRVEGIKRSFAKRPKASRENHYRWIADRAMLVKKENRYDYAYIEWLTQVRARDGRKCRIANDSCGGMLEVHHILSWAEYPELRYEVNNGITLCHAHHPKGRAKEKAMAPYFQGLVADLAN